MKKDFIMDNGKVRNCHANVAKMNAFEYVYYDFKDWGAMRHFLYYFMDIVKEFFKATFCLFVNILSLVFFPIVLLAQAQYEINKSKKFCVQYMKKE